MEKLTVKQIAEKSGKKAWKVYYVANKLGRLPTVEEMIAYKGKVGRPAKYNDKE